MVLFGVFIYFAAGVFSESLISIDLFGDAVEDYFILIFACWIIDGVFSCSDRFVSNSFGFSNVADVEEHSGVS